MSQSSPAEMSFASALSLECEVDAAVADLNQQLRAVLGETPPDLALVFVSNYYIQDARQIVEALRKVVNPRFLLGCTAESIIGAGQEVEDEAGISVIAAHLPGVQITPFFLHDDNWHALLLDEEEFRRRVGLDEPPDLVITLADPFSTPIDDVLYAFNRYYPGVPVVGGMASGALRSNGNTLMLDDRLSNAGLAGLALSGALEVDVVVSQGCRPVWQPFIIQSAQKNVIYNLEGQPPLAWIQELIPQMPEEERELLKGGLFVGRAIDASLDTLGRGDFLIRGVIGFDEQRGAIAIGDAVQEGERIQFHVRDALTAREDLEMMLIPQAFRRPPAGALLFSCNGRGTRLYDYPNGDVSVIHRSLGELQMAGFFAAGEIGPIGGRNFLHGHTASLVLFRPALDSSA